MDIEHVLLIKILRDYNILFIHHDLKSQSGNGLIYYKYEIDKVIICKNGSIPIKTENIKFVPIKPISKVWFGISRVCALEREGIDFGSFDIHSEITGKEKRGVDKYKDVTYLYYQVLLVIESYHKDDDESCTCLISR